MRACARVEILAMKKRWINLREGLIIVPRENQKTKRKDKRVPINSGIRPIIKQLLKSNKGSGFLCVNPTRGANQTKTRKGRMTIIKKACLKEKLGVDRIRLHDLRHTAATNIMRP